MAIQRFGSGIVWEEAVGYSRAVRAGPFVFVAGTTAVDADGVVRAPGDAYEQTVFALDGVEHALHRAGARLEQVVQTRMFVTDMTRAQEVGRAHADRFAGIRPVTAMVEVAALMDPRMVVEVEALAYLG
ncbi:MAG: RidA family protein [Actinomycetota bacterium]|nr:RidA family protein [Actinomycetota bacterium]